MSKDRGIPFLERTKQPAEGFVFPSLPKDKPLFELNYEGFNPKHYDIGNTAFYGGELHTIEMVPDAKVYYPHHDYTVKPFLFEDELRPHMSGAYWDITNASRVQLITSPIFTQILKGVKGKSWFIIQSPKEKVKVIEAGPHLHDKNPILTVRAGCVVSWIADQDIHQDKIIIEGLNNPHFENSFEAEVATIGNIKYQFGEESILYELYKYWEQYFKLAKIPHEFPLQPR